MKKLMFGIAIAALSSGCVWTQEFTEVTVHKDPDGKVLSVDYVERREQKDVKPWADFGGYIKQYGPKYEKNR